MNAKTERKQKSHDAILSSAAALLRERGIKASSVMDVMKGAGLTVGGFYGHFTSKEELFVATIQAAAHTMWNRLLAAAKGGSPGERAMSVVERYLSRRHRDHPEAGCILPNAAPEAAREGEPYRSTLQAEMSGFAQSFAALLPPGAGPAHQHQQALGLIALMYGALSLARAVNDTPLSDELLSAARAMAAQVLAVDAPVEA